MKLLIDRVTPSTTTEGIFYTKLTRSTVVKTVFGDKTVKETFYVKGTIALELGTTVDVNMTQFRVEEHPASFADKDTGEMITMSLKWLHAKVS